MIGSDEVFEDVPYILIQRFSYQRGESFWLYTSEHTSLETLEDIWPLMANARYRGSERCPFAKDFAGLAEKVSVHHFIRLEGVAFAQSLPAFSKVVFSAKVAGQLR